MVIPLSLITIIGQDQYHREHLHDFHEHDEILLQQGLRLFLIVIVLLDLLGLVRLLPYLWILRLNLQPFRLDKRLFPRPVDSHLSHRSYPMSLTELLVPVTYLNEASLEGGCVGDLFRHHWQDLAVESLALGGVVLLLGSLRVEGHE